MYNTYQTVSKLFSQLLDTLFYLFVFSWLAYFQHKSNEYFEKRERIKRRERERKDNGNV